MTKIECKIKRVGGSHVTLGGISYHFKPDDLGRHVADVENDDHADRLLSIHDGYRLVRDTPSQPAKKADSGEKPLTAAQIKAAEKRAKEEAAKAEAEAKAAAEADAQNAGDNGDGAATGTGEGA